MSDSRSPKVTGLSRLTKQPHSSPPAGTGNRWKPLLASFLLLTAFAAVVAGVFGDRLRPAVSVTTARALYLPGSGEPNPHTAHRQVLFQSSGWVEASPWPVDVTVLADGVVEEVLFQEGDTVSRGQVLVRMNAEDAALALSKAERRVEQTERECAAHAAGTRMAELEVDVAIAREAQAEAQRHEAEDRWFRVRNLSLQEVTESQKVEAEQQFLQASSALKEATASRRRTEEALQQQRYRQEAHADLLRTRKVEREEAQLRLQRMTVRSPINGVIQQRFVKPGSKRMLGMDDSHSAVVAEIFDPDHLRVRVDVPLSEAGNLTVGQPARITTSLLPGISFEGTVERIVGMADIQRNTLQAKVTLENPDPRLRPDTLCRVAFLSAASETASSAAPAQTVWVPASLADVGSETAEVWIVAPETSTVSRRTFRFGSGERDGLREVREGLRVNELVVLSSESPLKPGTRVRTSDL